MEKPCSFGLAFSRQRVMHLGGISQIEDASLANEFSAFRHGLEQARPGKMAPFGVPLVILILGSWQEQVESSDRLVV